MKADYNKAVQFFKDRMFSASLARPLFVCLFLLSWPLVNTPNLSAKDFSRALPVLLSIEELLRNEAQYDGHRVVVSGRIASLLFQQGRMGSPYLRILLLEDVSAGNIAPKGLEVITLDFPKARAGDKVLVQGDYHISGRKVGDLFERFIDAEVIILDEF